MVKDPETHIKEIAEPIVEQREMFLIDVEMQQGNETTVWVYVDSEKENLNVDKCSEISREISRILEEEDYFNSPYRLNVSSPGLMRPLNDLRQYPKNVGRSVKIKYKTDEGYSTIEGTLAKIENGELTVEADGNPANIAFDSVVETKIIPKI